MQNSMMSMPLTISSLAAHAAKYHGETDVISVETDGSVTNSNWREMDRGSRRLAYALKTLGLEYGDRAGTIAWNNGRHLQIYLGAAGGGYVCHTINPRLSPEHLIYIINHAEDRVLFFEQTFVETVAKLREHLSSIEHFVLMGPNDPAVSEKFPGILFFDDLIAATPEEPEWPELDENMPSSLCYTSGTTGKPKGVQYTHRSTVLHSMGGNQPDGLAISARDTVLQVVPMFHANAWGVPYIAAATGCKLVLPGPALDGHSLVNLIDNHKITLALGVPTIWIGLLAALKETGSKAESLQRTVVGGSALPPSMIPTFRDDYGVELIHAWGMTETSPLGSVNNLLQKHEDLSAEEQALLRLGQGRPPFGVELRLVDDEGNLLPEDGKTQGNLQIRGLWVLANYFKTEGTTLTADGWFDTGDVATLDPDGYMIIRDRSKDIIKSGGEWISTVELENIAIAHPEVTNAAAIAARHPKWDERPVIIAMRTEGSDLNEATLLASFEGKVPSWQVPDKVVFVETLPLGGTGKVLKNVLRDEYSEVLMTAD